MADERSYSIRDIARMTRVSPATVSKVLNGAGDVSEGTRQKVLRMVELVGYVPRKVRSGAELIAFVTPHHADEFRVRFVSELFDGIFDAASTSNYTLSVVSTQSLMRNQGKLSQYLRSSGIRGLLLRVRSEDDPLLQEVLRDGIPHVLLNRRFECEGVSYVAGDGFQGTYEATQHLLRLNHRRIALVGNAVLISSSFRERIEGYLAAFRDLGETPPPGMILDHFGGLEPEMGRQAVMELWSMEEKPTAAITFTEQFAMGFLIGLREFGISVPRDLSLITFDDIAGGAFADPPLTYVRNPAYQIGYEATGSLIDQLEGRLPLGSVRKVLPMPLMVRGSTTPLVHQSV